MSQNCTACQHHQPSAIPGHVQCHFPMPVYIRQIPELPVIVKCEDGAHCPTWKAEA